MVSEFLHFWKGFHFLSEETLVSDLDGDWTRTSSSWTPPSVSAWLLGFCWQIAPVCPESRPWAWRTCDRTATRMSWWTVCQGGMTSLCQPRPTTERYPASSQLSGKPMSNFWKQIFSYLFIWTHPLSNLLPLNNSAQVGVCQYVSWSQSRVNTEYCPRQQPTVHFSSV